MIINISVFPLPVVHYSTQVGSGSQSPAACLMCVYSGVVSWPCLAVASPLSLSHCFRQRSSHLKIHALVKADCSFKLLESNIFFFFMVIWISRDFKGTLCQAWPMRSELIGPWPSERVQSREADLITLTHSLFGCFLHSHFSGYGEGKVPMLVTAEAPGLI